MTLTPNQLERTARDMVSYCKEAVVVEQAGNMLYVFASELAVLRIFSHYLANGAVASDKYRVGFHHESKRHYFSFSL